MKKLVAYFSAEGTTSGFAKALAEQTGADLFEIKPEVPYSAADLKWTNPLARCNREKIGKKDVPVQGTVSGFDQYDTVYLGFPIWYSELRTSSKPSARDMTGPEKRLSSSRLPEAAISEKPRKSSNRI